MSSRIGSRLLIIAAYSALTAAIAGVVGGSGCDVARSTCIAEADINREHVLALPSSARLLRLRGGRAGNEADATAHDVAKASALLEKVLASCFSIFLLTISKGLLLTRAEKTGTSGVCSGRRAAARQNRTNRRAQ